MIAAILNSLAALPAVIWLVIVARRAKDATTQTFVRVTIEAVAASYVLAHVNRWFDLWKAHPYFPSGHETFAACVATALVALDRRFLPFMLGLLAILGYGLVRSGWHGRFEVIAGFLLGTIVMLVTMRLNRSRF